MNMLKVAYILDKGSQSNLIFDLIKKSEKNQYYSIEHLIIQQFENKEKSIFKKYLNSGMLLRTIKSVLFRAINNLEKKSLLKNVLLSKYFDTYELDTMSISRIEVCPIVSKSGFVYNYSKEDIEKIGKLDMDILLRGGSGILRGDILTICKYGVLSLHHGDNSVNRGGPPGFWEVYKRMPETGFIIQKLLPELDGGDVYMKGSIPTSSSYLMNLIKVSFVSNVYFDRVLEYIGKNKKFPLLYPKSPYSHELYRIPSLKVQLFYLAKTLLYKTKQIISQKLGKKVTWNVAYGFNKDWRNVELRKFTKIENPSNRFYADPFIYSKNGLNVCFVEDYDYNTSKGKISAISLTENGHEEIGTVIEEGFHMSYPYVFTNNNNLYMCPETHEARDIRIYRCTNFPLKWELHKVIMKNISAAETNIFHYNEKWWMLTNIDSSGIGDHSSELHLFFADNFDSDNWQKHPSNPIIFSSLSARNGGFIIKDNDLFRVFQRQGFDNYGESMGVAKIIELNENTYEEEVIFYISPDFFQNIIGTHTFSSYANVTAIDYAKIEKV